MRGAIFYTHQGYLCHRQWLYMVAEAILRFLWQGHVLASNLWVAVFAKEEKLGWQSAGVPFWLCID